jgi:Ran GTPase-activating protein (RanGAP) involved in mRNA processing and transport
MVEALKLHPQMKYLDVSANQIGSVGFSYFKELFQSNHTLETLHVRKNGISSGISDFPLSLTHNSNLFFLDLKDNDIDNDVASNLIELL